MILRFALIFGASMTVAFLPAAERQPLAPEEAIPLPSGIILGQQDLEVGIKEASSIFFNPADPSITSAKIRDALFRLMDIAVTLSQESKYGPDIKNRVDIAKDLFEKDSIFNDKGRQYLSFAYRMMTEGKKYEKPQDLDEFVTPAEAQEKARKYGQRLIEDALSALDQGKKGEAAKRILELVLMIVTPVSA
jgi:hypothetical protein